MTVDEARAELKSRKVTKSRLLDRRKPLKIKQLNGFLREDERMRLDGIEARLQDITQAIREARADLRAAMREAEQ